MSREVGVMLGILAIWAAATPVRALPITDVVNPADTYVAFGSNPSPCPSGFDCGAGWLSFTHQITDDGFNIGDAIASASVIIELAEMITTGVNHETYRYDIGNQTFGCQNGNCVPNSGVSANIALDISSLGDLASDGILRITINSLSGGFFFVDSSLTAEVAPFVDPLDSTPVPLPPTPLLFVAGLGALGASRLYRRPMA
jgi:hypothetical protein